MSRDENKRTTVLRSLGENNNGTRMKQHRGDVLAELIAFSARLAQSDRASDSYEFKVRASEGWGFDPPGGLMDSFVWCLRRN